MERPATRGVRALADGVETPSGAHLPLRARSCVARRPVRHLPDGTYPARMNLAGQKGADPGGVLVRVIEYRVDGGEAIRLLTDLVDQDANHAEELAALYHERWEAESASRQIKTFQRGRQEVLRSAGPQLVRQEVWAHLIVHHCLNHIIMRLADGHGIDPDRISFVKVLKHARRSVVRQRTDTPSKIRKFLTLPAAKVRRKLDNGVRRLREADRFLKRPSSLYSYRPKGRPRAPARSIVKQRHCPGTSKWNRVEVRQEAPLLPGRGEGRGGASAGPESLSLSVACKAAGNRRAAGPSHGECGAGRHRPAVRLRGAGRATQCSCTFRALPAPFPCRRGSRRSRQGRRAGLVQQVLAVLTTSVVDTRRA